MKKFICLDVNDINTYFNGETLAVEVDNIQTITFTKEALIELLKNSLEYKIIKLEDINLKL